MRHLRHHLFLAWPLAGAASLLLLASCSGLPFLSQSAAQLATGASNSWYKDAAFQFKGSLSTSEGTVEFNVTENSDGNQARGTGTLAGKPFTYVAASSNQYLKGQSFWQQYYSGANNQNDEQTLARGFENKYAKDGGNDVAQAFQQLGYLGGDISQLSSDASSFKKGGSRTINGRQATQLTFGGDTFWVAQGSPDQLVGFKAATAGQLQNVDVTIEPTKVPNVSAPSQSDTVDPNNPSTLPAYYQAESATNNVNDCSPTACVIQADILNQGGAPQGTSTVQMTAQDPDTNADIASCTATIPAIASNQDQTVSCTLTGPQWSSWANNAANAGGGLFFFNVVARITANPPYTGGSGS